MSALEQLELPVEDDAEFIARLQEELADLAWDFRTVPGLAKAMGVSEQAVWRVIDENPKLVRWIPATMDDEQMFVDRRRKRTKLELAITLRAYLAKDVVAYYR